MLYIDILIRFQIMKQTLLTICLIVFALPSWGETFTIDDLVERNDTYYKKFSNVPFTGDISGMESGSIRKGKKSGEWLSYHENGQLFLMQYYKDGKKEGIWEEYSVNGRIKRKEIYKNGILNSHTDFYYYEGGQLSSLENYKDGKLDGPEEYYYDNGQLMSKGNYKDGKKEGLWENYDKVGTQIKNEIWKDDKLVSCQGECQ